jgi:hypothetical protein
MHQEAFSSIVAALDDEDVEACVEAAGRLHKESEVEDIPALLALLESNDFFVREAAAWPLAELAGVRLLTELFAAYQRGFDEGHDNDGFTAALLEIPALHPAEAKEALMRLIAESAEPTLGHATWLLEFCES